MSLREYFAPSDQGVRKRDILREFVMQGGFRPGSMETQKALPRDMARFAISVAETPRSLSTGEATRNFYDTPFGRINSFQSEAANRVSRGDPMWKAMGNPMMDTLLAGSDIAGLAAGVSRLASPALRGMSDVRLKGFVKNPVSGDVPDYIAENQSIWNSRKPFRISAGDELATQEQISNVMKQRPGYEWGSGAYRYQRPAVQRSNPVLDMEGNEMVPPGEMTMSVRAGQEGGSGQAMPSSMNFGEDENSTAELIKRILMGKSRIIGPDDRPPINPRPYDPTIGDREQLLIDAGYRSDKAPNGAKLQGLWKLKNKEAFARFKDNPNVRPFVELNQDEDADRLVELMSRALSEGWDTGDVAASGNYMRRNGQLQPSGNFTEGMLPESYGDDITDEFSRTWHPGKRSFKREAGKEFYKKKKQ